MATSKRLRFSQKMLFLGLFALLAGAVAICLYFLSQTQLRSQHQQSSLDYRNSYHLSRIHAEALAFNQAIKTSTSDKPRLSDLKQELDERLERLTGQNAGSSLGNALKPLKALLDDFAGLHQHWQQAQQNLEGTEGVGLREELEAAYNQLEEIFANLRLASSRAALTELQIRQAQLVETPDSVNLVNLEEQVSRLVAMLPVSNNVGQGGDLVMVALNDYTLAAERYVSAHDKLQFAQSGMLRLSEKLSSDASALQAKLFNQAESHGSLSATTSTAFLGVLVSFIVVVVVSVALLRRNITHAFADFESELDHLDVSEGEDVSLSTLPGEFAVFADKLRAIQSARGGTQTAHKSEIDGLSAGIEKLSFIYAQLHESRTIEQVDALEGCLGELVQSLNVYLNAIGENLNRARSSTEDMQGQCAELRRQGAALQSGDVEQRKDLLAMTKALHVSLGSTKDLKAAGEAGLEVLSRIGKPVAQSETLANDTRTPADLHVQVSRLSEQLAALDEGNQQLKTVITEVSNLADRSHIVALNSSMCNDPEDFDRELLQDDLQQLSNHAREVSRTVSQLVSHSVAKVVDVSDGMSSLVDAARREAAHCADLQASLSAEKAVMGEVKEKLVAIDRNAERQSTLLARVCQKSKSVLRKAESRRSELTNLQSSLDAIKSTCTGVQQSLSEYQINETEYLEEAQNRGSLQADASELKEVYVVEEDVDLSEHAPLQEKEREEGLV